MPTVPFPQFCGKDITPFSSKSDTSKLTNLYRERNQSGDGPNDYSLIMTPGLVRAVQPSGAAGTHRGSYEQNDRLFQIVDDTLYNIDTNLANLDTRAVADDGLPAYMAGSSDTLMVVSAGMMYRYNSATFVPIVLPFVPTQIVFISGLFVALSSTYQQFFWSDDDGLTWPALNFQTVEATANLMIAMIVMHPQLWIIGNRVTQVFDVGTDPNTPFVPRQDAVIQQGTVARASVAVADNSLFWLGRNKNGQNTVVRMNGYNPENIATYAVQNELRGFPDVTDAIVGAFQLNGHVMVRWTFPTADRTLEFDATENDWHHVAGWDPALGVRIRHRCNTFVAAFGKILAGDHLNGWLYEMTPDVFADDDLPIFWLRQCPHLVKDGHAVEYAQLEVFGETGVGLAVGLGSPDSWDPQLTLEISLDGGKTWGNQWSRSMGKVGQYKHRMIWHRLGSGRDVVFRLSGSAPVKTVFTGAAFEAEALRS